MAVMREFKCPVHGNFESRFAVCPEGCVDVERVFLTAPATLSRRTKNIDLTLKQMARDRGLTDLSNKKGSLAASLPQFQPSQPAVQMPDVAAGTPMHNFLMRHANRFGSNFEVDPNTGAMWRKNSRNDPNSKARPDGKRVDTIMGINNEVPCVTNVQSECDLQGNIVKPQIRRFEGSKPLTQQRKA